jgi:hypothetical protein
MNMVSAPGQGRITSPVIAFVCAVRGQTAVDVTLVRQIARPASAETEPWKRGMSFCV